MMNTQAYDPNGIFDLSGKRVFLTGASSGIGRHFAATLAKVGAYVIMTARSVDKMQDGAEQIRSAGGQCEIMGLDVRDRDNIRECFARAEQGGPIDVLVNNAGVATVRLPQDLDDDQWDRIYETNLRGPWTLSQELIKRRLEDRRPCSIVNIASILGIRGIGHVASYAAAKAGLMSLCRDLCTDLAQYDIRVNAIAPGYIQTEMNKDWLASDGGERLRKKIPAKRFGMPAELDGALVYLASDASRYTNGAVLVVDGGLSSGIC